MKLLFIGLLIFSSLSLNARLSRAASLAKYEWEVVERADYYRLVVSLHDKSFSIRTSKTHVLLEEGAVVRMLVFDARGRVIGWPTPTSSPVAAKNARSPLLAETASSTKHDNTSPESPAGKMVVLEKKKAKHGLQEQHPSPELAAEMERLAELAAEEKDAFAGKPERYISASLGIGSDNIEASGGASRFQGSTKVGVIDLQFWWSRLEASASFGDLLGGRAHLHMHNFVTTKIVKIENSTDDYEETLSLGRAHAGMSLEHLLLRGEALYWYAGYGLGFFEAPRLAKVNADNAASDFSSHSDSGVILSTGLLLTPFADLHALHAQAQYWPWFVNNSSSSSRWLVGVEALYEFLPTLYGSLALRSSGESLLGRVNCQASVNTCRSTTSTTTTLSSLAVGLGLIF